MQSPRVAMAAGAAQLTTEANVPPGHQMLYIRCGCWGFGHQGSPLPGAPAASRESVRARGDVSTVDTRGSRAGKLEVAGEKPGPLVRWGLGRGVVRTELAGALASAPPPSAPHPAPSTDDRAQAPGSRQTGKLRPHALACHLAEIFPITLDALGRGGRKGPRAASSCKGSQGTRHGDGWP